MKSKQVNVRDFEAIDSVTITLSRMIRAGVLPARMLKRYTEVQSHWPYVSERDRTHVEAMTDIAERYIG